MVRSRLAFVLGSLFFAAGCAPAKTAEAPKEVPPEEGEPAKPASGDAGKSASKGPEPAKVEADAVENAIRPFHAVFQKSGEKVAQEIFLSRLAAATAVCVGERHDSVEDHALELQLLRGLLERRPMRGFELGIGYEMVSTEHQNVLDGFLSGKIPVERVPERTNWASEWGYAFELFQPQFVEQASLGGVIPLALGTPKALSSSIAMNGIDGLTEKELRRIPELDRSSPEHRKLFDVLMEGHPHGDAEKFYEAQLVWDESMAQLGAKFLASRAPIRKLLVVAGAAHCHRTAIPVRIERRTPSQVVTVLVKDPSAPAELTSGYDYVIEFE